MGFKLTVTTQEKDPGVTADSSMKTSAPRTEAIKKIKEQKNVRLNRIKNNTKNVINATTLINDMFTL